MTIEKTFALRPRRIFSLTIALLFAFTLVLYGSGNAIAADYNPTGPKEEMGDWHLVPLPPNPEDRMQSVHTSLLPNGKILMVNGSSNRNTLEKTEDGYKFEDGVNTANYDAINNTTLFDPITEEYERIDSPPAEQNGFSNDPFCSGHIHLANGNVLIISGSGRYYPGENFEGSKQSNVFDWKTNEWSTVGLMREGRWYPSLVTLASGKIAIFSGLKFGKPGQVSPTMELYDPETESFQFFDLRDYEDSPFNIEVNDGFDYIDLYPRILPTPDGRLLITGDGAGHFPLETHISKKSYLLSIEEQANGKAEISFEVGPDRDVISRVYGTALDDPNSDDILLIGGIIGTNDINYGRPYQDARNKELEANGISIARSLERWIAPEASGKKNGEWEIVEDFLDKPRAMNEAVILPSKEILVINGGEYGEYAPIYEPVLMTPDPDAPGGYKTTDMNPGRLPRLYHNGAILLPDARVIVVGGNPSRAGHSRDGTVYPNVIPNPSEYYKVVEKVCDRARENCVDFNIDDYYADPQAYYLSKEDSNGTLDPLPFIPAEIWQTEIFSPPYLFKPGKRPAIKKAPEVLHYGSQDRIIVKNADENGSLVLVKLGTLTHSFDYGQRLADLAINKVIPRKNPQKFRINFTTPDNANLYPPGYYMMFYVNEIGKPSVAKIVQLTA
ncbi:galactose oxidase early set domain-containing protein [Spirulina sp. 06S082]|uniref:galactose oxidase early set domain-containing protein n=1 Tax=Spirulina sp. 06S082 TaxID=3110248 RepID=UPI002B1F1AFD|nr:galactose oxidase early set domain-containing protein [Spirulina sp. 06S082]MEA5469013.1 galactose oxidase early set domain-containing protein [Spirulina sp. 06S082]